MAFEKAATDRIAPVVVALVRSAGIFLNMSIPRRPPMVAVGGARHCRPRLEIHAAVASQSVSPTDSIG